MESKARRPARLRGIGTSIGLVGCAAFSAGAAGAEDFAITHVSVIPMDRERVIEDQTVLVHDGRIEGYGPAAKAVVSKAATVIDGRGRYLIPGLTDMHVHIPLSADVYTSRIETKLVSVSNVDPETKDFFLLQLANGVTTVRNMSGREEHLALRDAINAGQLEGPRIFTTAAIMDGDPPLSRGTAFGINDGEKARAYVRWMAARKFDFVKVYGGLEPTIYDDILDEARKQSIPVVGHLPINVDFDHGLAGMKSIEHLTGFDIAFLPVHSKINISIPDLYKGWSYATREKIATYAGKVKTAGVAVVPTLVVIDSLPDDLDVETIRKTHPELNYWPAARRDDQSWYKIFQAPQRALFAGTQTTRRAIVKALVDAGAEVLTGTDTPLATVVPGFALHRELKNFTDAGLTPYQALAASTAGPARFFHRVGEFGTIVSGASADMVLLAANPLSDIRNVDRIEGVMVRGRWYPKAEIQKRMEAILAKNAAK